MSNAKQLTRLAYKTEEADRTARKTGQPVFVVSVGTYYVLRTRSDTDAADLGGPIVYTAWATDPPAQAPATAPAAPDTPAADPESAKAPKTRRRKAS